MVHHPTAKLAGLELELIAGHQVRDGCLACLSRRGQVQQLLFFNSWTHTLQADKRSHLLALKTEWGWCRVRLQHPPL